MMYQTLLFYCIGGLIGSIGAQDEQYPEQQLIKKLLTNYSALARPVTKSSEQVNVSIEFHLTKVKNLDASREIFETNGWLNVNWYDPRLKWKPEDYGDTKIVALNSGDVWFPSLALENSALSFYEFNMVKLFKIIVHSDGYLEWQPAGLFATYCHVHVFAYPFDTQICNIKFVDWTYTDDMVHFELGLKEVGRDSAYYQASGEWRIKTTSASTDLARYHGNDTFSRITFSLTLYRIYEYYFATILFPSVLLSFLVLLVYAVPREMGEKLSMGLTLMLSYFVFMLSVAENIPKSTTDIPLIQIYLLFYMSTTAFTVGISIMLLWLNKTSNLNYPPGWLHFIVYTIFANLICYGRFCGGLKHKYRKRHTEVKTEEAAPMTIPDGDNDDDDENNLHKEANKQAITNMVELRTLSSAVDAHEVDLADSKKARSVNASLATIRNKLKAVENGTKNIMNYIWNINQKTAEREEDIKLMKSEWKEIASIINTFAFFFLLLFTVVFIFMCIAMWVHMD